MHMGIEPSIRDDLESVGYMLVYFLKGVLPWQGVKEKNHDAHLEKICEIKICTKLDTLCKDIPDCFKKYIDYCRKLEFDQKPDYTLLKNLFKETGKNMDIELVYEWT